MISKSCANCGKQFNPKRNAIRFCSFDCGRQSLRKPILIRFWSYVHKTNSCWLWTGGKSVFGHGRFKIDGKFVLPHRFSYELHKGAIPFGMFVCHHCDNPACVNPEHLFLGTAKDNMQDAMRKHRTASGSKHGCAKLSDREVAQIRNLFNQGIDGEEIARRFRVSTSTISDIKTGKSWHCK